MNLQEAKKREILKTLSKEDLIELIIEEDNETATTTSQNIEILDDRKELLKDKEAFRQLALALCNNH